jgi:hypothetical protein
MKQAFCAIKTFVFGMYILKKLDITEVWLSGQDAILEIEGCFVGRKAQRFFPSKAFQALTPEVL